MKKAIVHQHYWPEDKEEKEKSEHFKVLFVDDGQNDLEQQLDIWKKRVRMARGNMEEAMRIIGGQSKDLSLFVDEVKVQDVPDDICVDEHECQHITALSVTSPEEIAMEISSYLIMSQKSSGAME